MVGRRILREKFSTKKSFEIEEDGDHFYMGSQEYHAKTNLLRELRSEKELLMREFSTENVNNHMELMIWK